MGVAAADYNRDGWLDIVKTNFDDDTRRSIATSVTAPSRMRRCAGGLAVNTRFLGWGTGSSTSIWTAGPTSSS